MLRVLGARVEGAPGHADAFFTPGRAVVAFLLLALPLSLWFAWRTPLGEVADEQAHLMRAVSLLDGQFLGHRAQVTLLDGTRRVAAGVTIDPAWEAVSRVRGKAPSDVALPPLPADAPAGFFPLYTIATYCPVFYAPAALGLATAKAFGWSLSAQALAGRLAMLAAYLALSVATLTLTKRARPALFCVLAVPMSLSLAASLNQDSLIIATAALVAALLSRGWAASEDARSWAWGVAAVLIALIILAKPPYAPLASLLFLPLPRLGAFGWPVLARRALLVALVVLPGLIWAAYAMKAVSTPVPRAAYEAGPLWPGTRPAMFDGTDPGAQLRVLFAEPLRLLTIPGRYLGSIKHIWTLAAGMVGILGWLDVWLPRSIYIVWALALIGVVAGRAGPAPELRRRDAGVIAAALLLALWAVLLSQYLSWTSVGEVRIDGPQGRYLLPLLPALALIVAAQTTPGEPRWRSAVAAGAPCLAALVSLLVIPARLQL